MRVIDRPFVFHVSAADAILSTYDRHIERRLSDLNGMFADGVAYDALRAEGDPLLYEVYEIQRPELAGELLHGLSVVHPGLVGDEYFMTKGHFHSVLETAEVYYCVKGEGVMVMETPEGEWAVEPFRVGGVLYVPPRWAHRSVNTGLSEDLVTFFVYPGNAGHDYGTIETQGFRKRVIHRQGETQIVDNPRWLAPENR
ncbi:MAG: glucose-6-phosphate isomerase [Anaerolineae bacterium]|nr:glucose-6-phosphate isomerase [Anaerolineae bacterium]